MLNHGNLSSILSLSSVCIITLLYTYENHYCFSLQKLLQHCISYDQANKAGCCYFQSVIWHRRITCLDMDVIWRNDMSIIAAGYTS